MASLALSFVQELSPRTEGLTFGLANARVARAWWGVVGDSETYGRLPVLAVAACFDFVARLCVRTSAVCHTLGFALGRTWSSVAWSNIAADWPARASPRQDPTRGVMSDDRHETREGDASGIGASPASGAINSGRPFATRRAALGMTAMAAAGFLADQALSPDAARAAGVTRAEVEEALTHATANTFLGTNALSATTTGGENTAIGHDALEANTVGGGNVAVGAHALAAAKGTGESSLEECGERNTAVGNAALIVNTTGGRNVAIGYDAMHENTTGSNNVAVGVEALQRNIAGERNTAIGKEALGENTTGVKNTAVGFNALPENQEGSENTVVGVDGFGEPAIPGNHEHANINKCSALGNEVGLHLEGGKHTLLGFQAGACTAAAGPKERELEGVVAIGFLALSSLTTGALNTAVGTEALRHTESGKANTAVGSKAMELNTSGENNTAVGRLALAENATGSNNVAVGEGALQKSATISGSTAVGRNALKKATAGPNTAIGYRALEENTTGERNVALGSEAGLKNETGKGNVFVGCQAGKAAVNPSNELFIANNETTAWIRGAESGKKIGFYGVEPVARPKAPGELTPATVTAKECAEAINNIRKSLKEQGLLE
jgi:hypothetical protein